MQGDSGLYGHATFAGELAQKLLSGSGFREAQAQPGAPFAPCCGVLPTASKRC